MGNHVKMVELRSHGIEKVGRHSARGSVEKRGQLRKADWRLHKLTAGAAAQDHLFDGVARSFRVRQRLKLNHRARVRRKVSQGGRNQWSASAPSGNLFWRIERRGGVN